ncbi:MAG: M48 family metalloprotease [Elusimicrobia bacterium]|nr:M48 family metalloprotease [Elusimicrobiota bacterium]
MTKRFALLLCVCAALSACKDFQLPKDRKEWSNLAGKAWDTAKEGAEATKVTPEMERAWGREASANMLAKYKLLSNDKMLRYVNLVGRAVARKAERQDVQWRFGILDTPDMNAYAAPGGYIFVTKGLLAALDDEAELAGVLAHEIQHVDREHLVKALRKAKGADFLANKTLGDKRAAEVAAKAIIGIMEQGFGKQDELDADKYGVLLLAKAGYDPTGLPRALRQTHAHAAGAKGKPFLERHPEFGVRMEELQKLSSDLPDSGAVLKDRFDKNVPQ